LPRGLRATAAAIQAPALDAKKVGAGFSSVDFPTALRTGLTMPTGKTWATIATIATRRPSGFVIGPHVTSAQALDFVHDTVDVRPDAGQQVVPTLRLFAQVVGARTRQDGAMLLRQPLEHPVRGGVLGADDAVAATAPGRSRDRRRRAERGNGSLRAVAYAPLITEHDEAPVGTGAS